MRRGFAKCAALLVSAIAAAVSLPTTSLASAGVAPRGASAAVRVELFGDSTGLVFGLSGATHAQALSLHVNGDARLGCGLVPDDHFSDGRVVPRGTDCAGWQARWKAKLRADPYAVVALMTGAWDVLDDHTSAGTVRFGTRAWTDRLTSSLRAAVEILTTGSRTLRLFEVPCYGKGDANYPLPERSDPKRVAAVNAIFSQAAKTMPRVEIVHWRTLVCPNGHRKETINGVRLWKPDDVHLSDGGGVVVWKWWLPKLRASR
jgi:hypothetical protein